MEHGQRREQKHRFKVYNHSGEVYGIFEAGQKAGFVPGIEAGQADN